MSRFSKPETQLKRSEELINVGQSPAALQTLVEVFASKRIKFTPIASLEPVMLRLIDLCVNLRRGKTARDALLQYKNVSQNTNVASIEAIIKRFISLADKKLVEAQEKANAIASELDVDDLEEMETPESMLLSSVSSDQSKDRTDRAVVAPWLKFLWEAYRTALDILRNNARLEIPYQQVANQALKFCLQYHRQTEFRRLCETLRTHLQNIARYSHQAHSINLSDPDTLQRHLDTRFAQLNAAVELELWQEAFRSVEDVHNLLTMAKKAPKPSMMANYYEKLARIFMVSDNHLFHAAAWNRYYALAKQHVKSEEEHTRLASCVLLSALAVPVISSSRSSTTGHNKVKIDFLQVDDETRSKNGRLTALLGLSRSPTRAGLLQEALNRNVLKRVRPELRELYNILEAEFHPLSICAKIEPIISQVAQDAELAKYVKPLHQVILTRLFQQLSQVYDAVKIEQILELVSAFKEPNSYDAGDIEKFVMNASKRGHLSISIDHVSRSVTFKDDIFTSNFHPAATTASGSSIDADVVKLQSTPSELVRTQLERLATCLNTTLKVIDPTILAAAQEAKKAAFAIAFEQAEAEHKAALQRKDIIARRKELVEELQVRKEKEEASARAERQKALQEAEAKRLAEETKRREAERVRKELEAVRIEEAKKLADSLREKSGITIDVEDYATLDTNKLVQMQVEHIEKEKKGLNEKLRIINKRIDHLERAYRREERPLLDEDYQRQQAEDLEFHKSARAALLEASREKHATDLEAKRRLLRTMPDYLHLRKVIEERKREEFEAKRERARAKIEQEKEKRRQQVLAEREEERRRAEEEERTRQEEEERGRLEKQQEEMEAELRAQEEAKRAELEAAKKAEYEERRRKLDEIAERQRQREAEVEERLRQKREPAAPAAPAAGGSVWRKGGPSGAVAEARRDAPSPTPAGPPRVLGVKTGGWREREKAKAAGETAAPEGASGASSNAPALTGRESPAPAAEESKPNVYRPGAFKNVQPGSWREREANRAASAQQPKADDDGFQTVSRGGAQASAGGGGAYRPPAARGERGERGGRGERW